MLGVNHSVTLKERIDKTFSDLFPVNRSLSGAGVDSTFEYLIANFLPEAELQSIKSGTQVFDWQVPAEWNLDIAHVENCWGEKIIDLSNSNLHVMSYSDSIDSVIDEDELLEHLHTLPDFPDRIPYRTSYYNRNWSFCCAHELLSSEQFAPPFRVKIDSQFDESGSLRWLECVKRGACNDEILISTYCCHPSLANDNLSGIILGCFLFEYLRSLNTKYTYRLLIAPETIGAISFLSRANTDRIIGGMVLSCVAGPDVMSIKEGFDKNHFVNQAAHIALKAHQGDKYITYPFVPDGSDERQYSSPGFRIVTPSIHKSKYYEYDEYHTSADDLQFVSAASLIECLEVHKTWIKAIESYSFPKRKNLNCEYQLGKRGLYPTVGGSFNQIADDGAKSAGGEDAVRGAVETQINHDHLRAFHWLMHMSDGALSNFEIARRAGLDPFIVNEAIEALVQKELVELL